MDAIVAVSQNWGIGKNGQLLFSLPTDLRRFQALTTGSTVILGYHTLLSLPGGKPLPKRESIVLTTQNRQISGATVVHSIHEALSAVSGRETPVFVIGGGSVYAALLPFCDHVYLTVVDAAPEADSFFPDLTALPHWQLVSQSEPLSENGLTFRYLDYANTAKK
ncbi:MAG: dihydrofolate reductase [Oscillospiraceae bacterium]